MSPYAVVLVSQDLDGVVGGSSIVSAVSAPLSCLAVSFVHVCGHLSGGGAMLLPAAVFSIWCPVCGLQVQLHVQGRVRRVLIAVAEAVCRFWVFYLFSSRAWIQNGIRRVSSCRQLSSGERRVVE